MGKIEKLNLNRTIDYSEDQIDYLIKENNTNNNLVSYEKIIHKIYNAKKTIQLSSTHNISNEIIDALYKNDEVNIYILLKSFAKSKQTLERFDSKKPAAIREVRQLENNLIIIDNIAYVFINSLENKDNIFIKIDEKKTLDLKYIFNYYFWDCATLEKLINIISEPVESPFPSITKRELEYINIKNYDLENLEKIYIPKEEKYKALLFDRESINKYVSTDINSIISQNQNQLQIGELVLKEIEFNITNKWVLTQNSLKEINTEDSIIVIDESWGNTINILDSKKVNLGSIESNIIEEMNTTEAEFLHEKYIKEINFTWKVLPPSKPNNAKKANLYSDFEKLNRQYKEYLEILNRVLTDLEKESGIISFFIGANRKAKQNLEKIEEYRTKNLTKLSKIDLEKFLEIEFKDFFESIIKSNTDFKEDRKRKEVEDKWKKEKEQKTNSLKSKETELKENINHLAILREKSEKKKALNITIKEIEKNIIQLKKEEKEYDKESSKLENLKKDYNQVDDKQKEQTKLNKSIKSIESTIDKLNKEIEDKYLKFNYKPEQNEIKNFNKNKINSNEYKRLNIPKYILPEVGVLYENKDSYFLEIIYKKNIEKANELKQRYSDKSYKVVIGIDHE